LLAAFAVFISLCGIFRLDPANPEHTFSSRVHVIVSLLAGIALFPTTFFLWLATRHDPDWTRFRGFSLFMQAAGLVATLLLTLGYFRVLLWRGFAERSFWGVYYLWIVGLALKLRRMAESAQPVGHSEP